jgi:hypothetical protein
LPPLPPVELLELLASPTPEPTTEQEPEPAATEVATPQPPAAPYEPVREPVRAATQAEAGKGPLTEDSTPAPPAAEVAAEPTPAAAAATTEPQASLKPVNSVSNQAPEPPLSLTPSGVAQGGPGEGGTSGLPTGMLMTVGALLLAGGGSWGAYYFLRPPAD